MSTKTKAPKKKITKTVEPSIDEQAQKKEAARKEMEAVMETAMKEITECLDKELKKTKKRMIVHSIIAFFFSLGFFILGSVLIRDFRIVLGVWMLIFAGKISSIWMK